METWLTRASAWVRSKFWHEIATCAVCGQYADIIGPDGLTAYCQDDARDVARQILKVRPSEKKAIPRKLSRGAVDLSYAKERPADV
jgi:hypothetical protein